MATKRHKKFFGIRADLHCASRRAGDPVPQPSPFSCLFVANRAFTLLEVIVALAIFALAAVVLGTVLSTP